MAEATDNAPPTTFEPLLRGDMIKLKCARIPDRSDGITEWEFDRTMIGEGWQHVEYKGEITRLRYIVADAFDVLAKEKQKAGRPDRASLLRHISMKLRYGSCPTKRVVKKAAREIEEVARRVVRAEPAATVDAEPEWSPL